MTSVTTGHGDKFHCGGGLEKTTGDWRSVENAVFRCCSVNTKMLRGLTC